MPKGNRVDTSRSLGTSGIWANTIGHDPYAPVAAAGGAGAAAPSGNVYEASKAALAQARLAGGVVVDADRGLWQGTGRLKGYKGPGRGGPEEAAPPPAPPPPPPPPPDDSDVSGLSSSESESARRQRKAKKRAKKEEKRAKKEAKKRAKRGRRSASRSVSRSRSRSPAHAPA